MNRSLFIQLSVVSVVLLTALCCVIASTFFLHQTRTALNEVRRSVAEAQAQVQRVEAAKAALPILTEAEGKLMSRVVRPKDIVPFLESLERQGGAQGATVEVLSVTGGDGAPRVSLSIKISGTFDAVMRTVGRMEHRGEDIVVTSLTLDADRGEDSAATGKWVAAVVLSVGANNTP